MVLEAWRRRWQAANAQERVAHDSWDRIKRPTYLLILKPHTNLRRQRAQP